MIVGVGIDLVEIGRLRSFRARWGGRGLERLFTAAELEYCLGQADPAPSLAVRFAAKEAFFKAVGTGWGRGGGWRDVEVVRPGGGPPQLRLIGPARRALVAVRASRVHVTLTHARSTAAAVVVVER
ncbi:MAG: holo-ACP synthase [Gemmatimonadota bacterium]